MYEAIPNVLIKVSIKVDKVAKVSLLHLATFFLYDSLVGDLNYDI